MCIAYFADHRSCYHTHFLGAYHCTDAHCTAQHIFYIEDSGNDCETCIAMHGKQLDPDCVPVQYDTPDEDFDIDFTKEGAFDKVVKVSRGVYQRSEASLSDIDSETSHWREDRTTDEEECAFSNKPTLYREQNGISVPEGHQATLSSPNTTGHRGLVRDQLACLPQSPEPEGAGPFRPSPNTTQHRNLVNDQLAHLRNHLAYQQPVQPIVLPNMPHVPYYTPPAEAMGAQSPSPFYEGYPAHVQMPWPHTKIP
ncbi:uncharacterized protein K460DRAFT_409586 [Cucurbitaria berberidis CBS 394.84]|uniref:Uncharacterized protein n=1 Tax=Cucurbitaria berberidis CBS 394.84 TaxID=1168544 RepID=A0A9P4L5B3_9PLEO|nr:uncharacterized protein K460DRAFT_409586 [Cucurbitaria berberidis CBS 394.84]KAF1842167.1 hypothetical protein K460DRAFT_409586 [Cucurbitaria berberidis CBS 394.84]